MAHSRQAACSYQQEKFPTQNGSSKNAVSWAPLLKTQETVSSGMAGTRHLNNFALLSLALAVFSGRFLGRFSFSCSVG